MEGVQESTVPEARYRERFQGGIEAFLNSGIEVAKRSSPCIRRRYAAQIICAGPYAGVLGTNERVSRACDTLCARTRLYIRHGERVEVGAEVHAEQSALINWTPFYDITDTRSEFDWHFMISGWDMVTQKELFGRQVYPCHVCALMVKHAGFRTVILRNSSGDIDYVSIDQIIEEREQEWESP